VARTLEDFSKKGAAILFVVQAKPPVLERFLKEFPQPFAMACDPDRNLYKEFRLERVSWLTFFRPKVIWGYLRLMFRGQKVRAPYTEEDVQQLGGDFILNQTGKVVYEFRSQDPTARPTMNELLDAMETATRNSLS